MDLLAEVVRDDERYSGRAFVEQAIGIVGPLHQSYQIEVLRVQQAVDEAPTCQAAVLIEHGRGDVFHVKRERVAVEHDQHGRQEQQKPERADVPTDLPELLEHDAERAVDRQGYHVGPLLLEVDAGVAVIAMCSCLPFLSR